MRPAEKLSQAIKAEKLAQDNFDNYDLYCVLKYRACVLKLEHAQMMGAACVKIITEKYKEWIFDDSLKAKSIELAIIEKFGIKATVSLVSTFIHIVVGSVQSAETLLRKFSRHGILMKANAYNNFEMTIPLSQLTLLKS